MIRSRFIPVLAALMLAPPTARAQLTPQEAIALMPRGINIGNTLEPPDEGGWNNGPLREYYFDDYVAAGFDAVRIPVRWDEHTGEDPPYPVTASWMDRVEQVVDWGLARGLFIIINAHHEEWIKAGYADPGLRDRFDAIWRQIAERFRAKSDRLFFEIINEPYGMTPGEVDDLNARVLGIIRETNPTRIVVYSGNEWSSASRMMAAAVPDDDYLMAYYHSYDPWSFAGEAQGTWGSDGQRAELAARFAEVAAWSAQTGVPVMVSEFGAVRQADYNSRMAHYASYVDGALRNGIAFQVWDDGGDFGVYQRDARTWGPIGEVLTRWQTDGPDRLTTMQPSNSSIVVSWTNRADTYDAIDVQRTNWLGEFETMATVAGDAESYEHAGVSMGGIYTYRLVAHESGQPDRITYPHRHQVVPVEREMFIGVPFPIPGVIEAEDFDMGGEGLTYHDNTPDNIPGAYRPEDAVDIAERSDGGFHLTGIEPGEWVEYTVDVAHDGDYRVTVYAAAMSAGGFMQLQVQPHRARPLLVPASGDWETTATASTTMSLTAGKTILRFTAVSGAPFNLDRIVFEAVGGTATEELPESGAFLLYPNPVRDVLSVELERLPGPSTRLELIDGVGRVVRRIPLSGRHERIAVDRLSPGVYVVRVVGTGETPVHRTVVLL